MNAGDDHTSTPFTILAETTTSKAIPFKFQFNGTDLSQCQFNLLPNISEVVVGGDNFKVTALGSQTNVLINSTNLMTFNESDISDFYGRLSNYILAGENSYYYVVKYHGRSANNSPIISITCLAESESLYVYDGISGEYKTLPSADFYIERFIPENSDDPYIQALQ